MDDPREAGRLAKKVDAAGWVEKYLAAFLADSREILDVGCGPGTIASEVARRCPRARVTGIDLSPERFGAPGAGEMTAPNLVLQVGDVLALEYPDNHFDLLYCRFLLEYLEGRGRAMEEMVRVCKPGGRVLLQDLDGQLLWHYPPDEVLEEMLPRVVGGLSRTGFDPFVGRKLFSLARRAGLADIEVEAESYHLFAGRIDEHNLRLWELKLDIALRVAAEVIGGIGEATRLKARFLEYLQREDTMTYSVLFTVIGSKKCQ